MKTHIRFKAAHVGQKFTRDGVNYRKASTRGAYRLNANGTGQTHAQVPFARNTFVAVE